MASRDIPEGAVSYSGPGSLCGRQLRVPGRALNKQTAQQAGLRLPESHLWWLEQRREQRQLVGVCAELADERPELELQFRQREPAEQQQPCERFRRLARPSIGKAPGPFFGDEIHLQANP